MDWCADFYVGVGPDAEWLGSVGENGWQWAAEPGQRVTSPINLAKTEEEYRAAVRAMLLKEDGLVPELGWPWEWDDSTGTDYAYSWYEGRVQCWEYNSPPGGWPDMSKPTVVPKEVSDQLANLLVFGGSGDGT